MLPQWNSGRGRPRGPGKLLNRFGISALRMTWRITPSASRPRLQRADYHVSSNVGRTIHAARQSVIDARACLDWLQAAGLSADRHPGHQPGILHRLHHRGPRPADHRSGVFNHVSMYFSDVVWTGLSTQHVRQGFADDVTQDELRQLLVRDQPGRVSGAAARAAI